MKRKSSKNNLIFSDRFKDLVFALVISILWLLITQWSFFQIQKNQTQTTVKTLNSLFHSLLGPSNFQTLGAVITDLEVNGTIRCPIISINLRTHLSKILDLSYRGDCSRHPWILNGDRVEMRTTSGNGDDYLVQFSTVNSIEYLIGLWSFRFFGLLVILGLNYFRYYKLSQERKINEANLLASKATEELAKQVSHDIRSPLSALNLVVGTLTNIPEDKRVIIRSSVGRITDIANQLLNKNRKNVQLISTEKNESIIAIELLPALIEVLISEKRIQFREKSNISIETDFDESYGAFAKINSSEFKRVLSNVINNSVEALQSSEGRIIVSVKSYSTKTIVSIRDNGSGIPQHILDQLGNIGISHGKDGTESGSGLGVYHAKKTIESFGAKFEIVSQQGFGTEIRMEFPKCEIPSWFVPELQLTNKQIIVALDDDQSILEIWKQRIRELCVEDFSVNLITLTSENDFQEWIYKNKESISSTLFLMDYELINQKHTGLDLIQKLSLQKNSILVTSRYEEPLIRKRCEEINVRQIPKAMAPYVPILKITDNIKVETVNLLNGETKLQPTLTSVTKSEISDEVLVSKIRYDLCLLDDDKDLIQATWGILAKNKNLKIRTFTTPQEFFAVSDSIDRQTPIYVDVSLGDGIKGTDIAMEIYKLGFEEINLATGYEANTITVPSFINKVCGKDFPL